MSHRHWLPYAAIAGCLAAFLWGSAGLAQRQLDTGPLQNQQTSQQPKDKAGDKTTIKSNGTVAPIRATPPNNGGENGKATPPKTQKSNQKFGGWVEAIGEWITGFIERRSDTLAQWFMALFGVIATVISGVAVELLRRTLKATKEAAEYTKGMLDEAVATTAAAQESARAAREEFWGL